MAMEIGSLFICFDSYQAKQDFSQLINSLSWAIFGVQLPAILQTVPNKACWM